MRYVLLMCAHVFGPTTPSAFNPCRCCNSTTASRVRVRLRFLPRGRISVLMVDDGIGFDKAAVLNGHQSERNIGLYGMIERTELAGGRLHIRTREGSGVAIRAVL